VNRRLGAVARGVGIWPSKITSFEISPLRTMPIKEQALGWKDRLHRLIATGARIPPSYGREEKRFNLVFWLSCKKTRSMIAFTRPPRNECQKLRWGKKSAALGVRRDEAGKGEGGRKKNLEKLYFFQGPVILSRHIQFLQGGGGGVLGGRKSSKPSF